MLILKQTATFRKWHKKLKDGKAKATIALRLQRLANGHAGDASPIGEGLSELRIHYGPGYRIYYCKRGETIIVLLCDGDKSTQETDIRTAKRIASEWSDDNG
ncbi:type II toxin-antitoxin system RelE/ParE family toxin [Rhizobium sp. 1AS11]|uniref:type II toxin-antitoxin system RelE/ParE family toxin n=1 Tax=Rhizobium acaciae TaxID=2989736 RepID=UPI00221EA535|nr:type II toxin-antitoxin system RelE/ParE family toxin [Rhizobium acaciae]MCW1413716.1 type II toxin-antitoxin system RelE/ParE family toxin [Rhizobium acaciae]MCW1745889.1 type II toxin-antitoxin system RelE/ParE family toxin [Rhizobium acaciae]MCW1754680.1 type II toxin-antitoxin system RelE/ParE family toxin [Rhizobium acaciae]